MPSLIGWAHTQNIVWDMQYCNHFFHVYLELLLVVMRLKIDSLPQISDMCTVQESWTFTVLIMMMSHESTFCIISHLSRYTLCREAAGQAIGSGEIFMLSILSLLVSSKVVVITTCSVTSYDKVFIMTTREKRIVMMPSLVALQVVITKAWESIFAVC